MILGWINPKLLTTFVHNFWWLYCCSFFLRLQWEYTAHGKSKNDLSQIPSRLDFQSIGRVTQSTYSRTPLLPEKLFIKKHHCTITLSTLLPLLLNKPNKLIRFIFYMVIRSLVIIHRFLIEVKLKKLCIATIAHVWLFYELFTILISLSNN